MEPDEPDEPGAQPACRQADRNRPPTGSQQRGVPSQAAADGVALSTSRTTHNRRDPPGVPGHAAELLAADGRGARGAGALLPPADAVPVDAALPVPDRVVVGHAARGEAAPHRPLHRPARLRDAHPRQVRGGTARGGAPGQVTRRGGDMAEEAEVVSLKETKKKAFVFR